MTQQEINELYDTNEKFKQYVDRYVRCKPISVENALKLKIIQLIAEEFLTCK